MDLLTDPGFANEYELFTADVGDGTSLSDTSSVEPPPPARRRPAQARMVMTEYFPKMAYGSNGCAVS